MLVPGPLRYIRQALSRNRKGIFFTRALRSSSSARQVCSCVAWFRTDTCVITHKSTSRHSRAHVVGIHVCQPRTLARKRATHIVVQHTAHSTDRCQLVRPESDVANGYEGKGETEERGRGKAESDVRTRGWIIVRTLRSGIARPPRLNCDQGLNGDFQGRWRIRDWFLRFIRVHSFAPLPHPRYYRFHPTNSRLSRVYPSADFEVRPGSCSPVLARKPSNGSPYTVRVTKMEAGIKRLYRGTRAILTTGSIR